VEIPDTGILPIRKCIIKKTTDGVETRVSITIPYRSMSSPSMRSQRVRFVSIYCYANTIIRSILGARYIFYF